MLYYLQIKIKEEGSEKEFNLHIHELELKSSLINFLNFFENEDGTLDITQVKSNLSLEKALIGNIKTEDFVEAITFLKKAASLYKDFLNLNYILNKRDVRTIEELKLACIDTVALKKDIVFDSRQETDLDIQVKGLVRDSFVLQELFNKANITVLDIINKDIINEKYLKIVMSVNYTKQKFKYLIENKKVSSSDLELYVIALYDLLDSKSNMTNEHFKELIETLDIELLDDNDKELIKQEVINFKERSLEETINSISKMYQSPLSTLEELSNYLYNPKQSLVNLEKVKELFFKYFFVEEEATIYLLNNFERVNYIIFEEDKVK